VNAAELKALAGTVDAPAVTADASARCAALATACDTVVSRWLERAAAYGR